MSDVRTYSGSELRALRVVDRHEWGRSGNPSQHGPAQYAGGLYWPNHLRELADDFERRVKHYRLAADAMEREIRKAGLV